MDGLKVPTQQDNLMNHKKRIEIEEKLDVMCQEIDELEKMMGSEYGICKFGKEVIAVNVAINKLKSKVFVHEKSVMEAEALARIEEQGDYAAIKAAAIEHERDDERYEY